MFGSLNIEAPLNVYAREVISEDNGRDCGTCVKEVAP